MITTLIIVISLLLVIILIMAIKWPKVIELTDIALEKDSPKNRWLKFQNEGGKYVHLENGNVNWKLYYGSRV